MPGGATADTPTFSKEVSPILQKHCQDCHRPGRVGPMPLLTFEQARPWAKAIKKVVAEETMPPWHADPSIGKWKNDRRLDSAEKQTLMAWVDAGAPEGNPKELPPPRKFIEGWAIGQPDAIFTMVEEQVLPAELEDEYRTVRIPTGLTEDNWIIASEVQPGNYGVVHHLGVSASTSQFAAYDRQAIEVTVPVAGYTPGEQKVDPLPNDQGVLLPAGSDLVLEVHYHKEPGKEERDRSSIGLIFSRTPIRKRARALFVANNEFVIPPGAGNHEVEASFTMPLDAHITALQPHMHLRGKDMRVTMKRIDGSVEDLLFVPRYDFDWQTRYEFMAPLAAPKGTQFFVKAHFDNSTDNKSNPDPAHEVREGMSTTEEMMLCVMGFNIDGEDMLAWRRPTITPAMLQSGVILASLGSVALALFALLRQGVISRIRSSKIPSDGETP